MYPNTKLTPFKELRLSRRLGPLRLVPLMGVPSTTLYRYLRRLGLGRLPMPLRPQVVRYEVDAPGKRKAQSSFGFSIKRVLPDNDVTFDWTFRPRWRGSPPEGVTRFTRTLQAWGSATASPV